MKYLSQINGFWNWRRLNPITSRQADLYFAILDCANSAGWPEQVTIPNTTLILMCNTNKTDLHRNRLELIQKGLITYQKGKKGNAGVYEINPLYETNNETNKIIGKLYGTNNVTYPVTNNVTNSVTNPVINPGNIYREEKKREEKTDRPCAPASGDGVVTVAESYQQLTGNCVSRNMYDLLGGYIGDGVEPELICALLDYAAEKGVNNLWRYTEKAVMRNMDKGIYTLAAYRGGEEKRKETPKQMENASAYEDVTDRIMREWRDGNDADAV